MTRLPQRHRYAASATARFVPLIGSQRTLGSIGVRSKDPDRFADPDQSRLLETCASLVALSLERDQSVLEASDARVRVETEEMRSALLSSVSHDLRTPLAIIAAASANLLEGATIGRTNLGANYCRPSRRVAASRSTRRQLTGHDATGVRRHHAE